MSPHARGASAPGPPATRRELTKRGIRALAYVKHTCAAVADARARVCERQRQDSHFWDGLQWHHRSRDSVRVVQPKRLTVKDS